MSLGVAFQFSIQCVELDFGGLIFYFDRDQLHLVVLRAGRLRDSLDGLKLGDGFGKPTHRGKLKRKSTTVNPHNVTTTYCYLILIL